MSIIFTDDIKDIDRNALNALYNSGSGVYELFENSFLTVAALDGTDTSQTGASPKLAGALRVLSEGVETALLVDLRVSEGYDDRLKASLILQAEKKLAGRRVMVFGSRENLGLFEELGYGRCKNAWTYFRAGMSESDFLPAGYRFENEFTATAEQNVPSAGQTANRSVKNGADIEYRNGFENTTFDDINTVLSKAFGGRPHDVNRTTAAFSNSRYSITAYDGQKLVGVARAVSDAGDRTGYATILNVAVDPEYQGLSIGKNMVLRLSANIDARVIVLNTHPGAVGFYNKLKEYRRNKYVFEKFLRPVETPDQAADSTGGRDTAGKPDTGEKKPPKGPDWAGAMFTPKGYRYPDEY
ncbi:MAG: GNAT family N-acetyltransferase [Lachnospiraceae bacterium]|nr:GNAT family N-acetyltransferase [Lachnospiraceae bacterium]